MTETLTITDAPSSENPKQKITIPLTDGTNVNMHQLGLPKGNSPWFNFIWINDVRYAIIRDNWGTEIKKHQPLF